MSWAWTAVCPTYLCQQRTETAGHQQTETVRHLFITVYLKMMKHFPFKAYVRGSCYRRLTRTARHVALDSDLPLHVGLHQNPLQRLTSRSGGWFTFFTKCCFLSGLLTLEPMTTDSLSITSTKISLFPPCKKAKSVQFSNFTIHALILVMHIWNIFCIKVFPSSNNDSCLEAGFNQVSMLDVVFMQIHWK